MDKYVIGAMLVTGFAGTGRVVDLWLRGYGNTVTNRSMVEKRKRGARLLAWIKKPWRCKLDAHPGMHRIHIYLGDGGPPPACYCNECGDLVRMARLKGEGWYEHRIYGKIWQNGPNRTPQPGTRDLREVYWIEDPIAVKVVRSDPHPGTTGDIKPTIASCEISPPVIQADFGGGKEATVRTNRDITIECRDGVHRSFHAGDLIPLRVVRLPIAAKTWGQEAADAFLNATGQLVWETKGRHAGFRAVDPIDDYIYDLIAQPTTGGCAVCGADLYGAARICDECCQKGRGA